MEIEIGEQPQPPVKCSNFFSNHWKGLVVFLVPLLCLPVMLLNEGAEFRCMYLLLVMAIFWVTEALPLYVTSMIPIVAFPIMGIMSSDQTCRLYFKDTLVMFMGGIMVALAVEYCNLHKRLALRVIQIVGCSPRRLHFGLIMVTMFLSMWISNAACTAMMCPIIQAVLEELQAQGVCKINHEPQYQIVGGNKKNNEAQSKEVLPEKRKASSTDDEGHVKKVKLDANGLKTKRPGFSDERYDETSYYFENGLRKVYPYFFTFTTFAKGRWVDEKILDVFVREFRAAPPEEYERSLEAGKLTVNSEKVPKDYRIKHNDLLANVVHRHEVPVTSQPIKIVYMDKDIVVVNKPASIPVHPCGRYRHNTVVFILAKEHNLKNLRTIHRLDRLTSGLLLFGRTAEKARELELQIRTRQVQKEYVCRVEGRFPDGIVECNEKIDVVSYKIGVCKVSPKGKDCKTTFKRIGEVGSDSIVLCKPLTGRMHQIRVHLQYLGYPISNDPLYNHEVFGPLKGRGGDIGGITEEQLISNLISIHNAETWLGLEGDQIVSGEIKDAAASNSSVVENPINNSETEKPVISQNLEPSNEIATQTCYEEPDRSFDSKKATSDPQCSECKLNYRDPGTKDLIMYLHAWKYKGVGWEYETELPDWACNSNIDYDQV